ncbi:BREX system P-loop protein BrxC [Cylindrospermopsis raciborskii UAM/DH-BiRr]|uniref:BREX system P-loop protein BrxC n=1 Tax=Cylindrospermopsis raciborskii TaxID=77022 RepID=UPI00387968D9
MTLKTIFQKPIDRPIEGVIKADDEASLRIEIEEYVLTNEIEKRLEEFLHAYNNYQGANGVWVSGFFGSGKSHLLKMLALLLENRSVDGIPVLHSFLPKCGENEMLRGDLKKAVSIPSKSILFNIDQKADVISKTEIDALLAVFVKVFDEMCGYYGKHGYIAQFERDLDSRGQYESFKSAYKEVAHRPWEEGREQALLESKNIAIAYGQTVGGDAIAGQGILDKYRNQYKVSIEDFAKAVLDYVEQQGKNFRLNFFVDEVGQYIADNVKLMTNLQTVAESLATKCRGRAWIMVTAQEDMDSVLGEDSRQQTNDFSKIQARFANRMKLTSQDVAEVIQKRLLMKNEVGKNVLSKLYDDQANNFKTLFDFVDGSQTYRNFQDRDHFIQSYPFIPYQFPLFQAAIQNLSAHNAFEGKHSSVGERSMLGVFQQVAIQISEYEEGQLATFDLMFEGIRSALKSSIQRAILQGERQLNSPFAIQLLKALFLVKYVKEFKATQRNLCVLMFDRFNCHITDLRKRVEEGLNLLEQETYIQRHGELYEYLTDEEKDVEQEIKNTEVDKRAVAEELEKLVFDHTLKLKKIRSNSQDYPFCKKIDDRLYSRECELTIHIISPFNENAENEDNLRAQSMGRDELVVIIPPEERLMRDLIMYKQTDKYISQNVSITQKDSVKSILTDKNSQNRQRYTDLQQRVHTLLSKSKLILNGSYIEVGGDDPQNRILKGFEDLILKTYPNLQMLRGMVYTEKDLSEALNKPEQLREDTEPEQEVLASIQRNKDLGVRTTLKTLIDKFERKPYGWHHAALLHNVASLCARGKLEVRWDSNLLDGNELLKALTNTRDHMNIILEPQIDFTASQVRALKKLYTDFFNEPAPSGDAKLLGQKTATAISDLIDRLEALSTSHYPFKEKLSSAIARLRTINGKPYAWYVTDLLKQKDELLDLKEQTIYPICTFMNGSQRNIFDSAQAFVKEQEANFWRVNAPQEKKVREILADPHCFRGDRMQQLKELVTKLREEITTRLNREIEDAVAIIESLRSKLVATAEFHVLSSGQQTEIASSFDEYIKVIKNQKLIAVIRDRKSYFEQEEYERLRQIVFCTQPGVVAEKANQYHTNQEKRLVGNWQETQSLYVSHRSIQFSFDKEWLADETDVEQYVAVMREALLAEVRSGRRVQL